MMLCTPELFGERKVPPTHNSRPLTAAVVTNNPQIVFYSTRHVTPRPVYHTTVHSLPQQLPLFYIFLNTTSSKSDTNELSNLKKPQQRSNRIIN